MKDSSKKIVLHYRNELHRVERFVEDICDYNNVTNEYFGNILLTVTEAVEILFSIFGMESILNMEILFDKIPKGLKFVIRIKENEEFSDSDEDVLDKEVRKHKLGRELFIVRSLTDELAINKNAKGITMVFYVTSINFEKSLERVEHLKSFWRQEKNIIQH
jgi:hypothetical protein